MIFTSDCFNVSLAVNIYDSHFVKCLHNRQAMICDLTLFRDFFDLMGKNLKMFVITVAMVTTLMSQYL